MTSARSGDLEPQAVLRSELKVGRLLAEGGEGKVFELPLAPHLVFKEYRRPAPRAHLEDLLAWPASGEEQLLSRVHRSTSWPRALVEEPSRPGSGMAVGVLIARAPRRFALRHRDGSTRMATLSYLTADPAHREVAYGLSLPPAFSPERIGIVYALARLLEAFEGLSPKVGHGDLSAKNVLWSLQRGPEVFVIDCDNCERYGPDLCPLGAEGRRRPMTPNWEDPAVAPGGSPELVSDRYSLALIFLRVVGAANFPVQARQRQGEGISIDFPVPPGYAREVLLGPSSPLWSLCERGLSCGDPLDRPGPGEWVAALETVLDGLGAGSIMRAVWETQGGGPSRLPSFFPAGIGGRDNRIRPDVTIRPVLGLGRQPPPKRLVISPPEVGGAYVVVPQSAAPAWGRGTSPAWGRRAALLGPASGAVPGPPAGGGPGAGAGLGGQTGPRAGSSPGGYPGQPGFDPVLRQLLAGLGVAVRWWVETHLALLAPGSPVWRRRLRRAGLCFAVDLAIAAFGLFLGAMAIAPLLGI